MSQSGSEEQVLMYTPYEKWNCSNESILNQKLQKLSQSECLLKFCEYSSGLDSSHSGSRNTRLGHIKEKANWQMENDPRRMLLTIQMGSPRRNELEMLRVNLSGQESKITLRESLLNVLMLKKKKPGKMMKFVRRIKREKAKDLCSEIERSDTAKTDKVTWKFLTRGPSFKKEIIHSRRLILKLQTLHLPGVEFLPDSRFQNSQPVRVTCPNCRFFVTTKVKKVSTIRTKLSSAVLSIVGLCIVPHVFYAFKDTVHVCPLCKIYLGFCPAFKTRLENMSAEKNERRENSLEKHVKMVSASSTSAKNLFIESKLRLSDRVQVNVNNIAAITRQIQRGSKASENLTAAAKNLALQEAAIENSETSLKKLKLLTSQINSQLDSLQSTSAKMEVVLEQVCSMQR